MNFADENEESLYEENNVELMQLHYIQNVNADADSNRPILLGTLSDAGHQDSTFGKDENNKMETATVITSGSPTVTTVGSNLVPSTTTVALMCSSHMGVGSATGILAPSITTTLPMPQAQPDLMSTPQPRPVP